MEFTDPQEVMIAQESQLHEVSQPAVTIVKPNGVTNSHRPQYDIDSIEANFDYDATKKRDLVKNHQYSKEGMIRDAVLRALERKDHVGKFAQIVPIIRAMSGTQRNALASLVASQVTVPPGRQPLNLAQVRSLFGSNNATVNLMLPILLDTANLIKRASRTGKQTRDVVYPQAHIQRRSITEDTLDEERFDTGAQNIKWRHTNISPQSHVQTPIKHNTTNENDGPTHNTTGSVTDKENHNIILNTNSKYDSNVSKLIEDTDLKVNAIQIARSQFESTTRMFMNGTAESQNDTINQTLGQNVPFAQKLRSLNRYVDRKGNLIRRGTYPQKPATVSRRTTAEPSIGPIIRRRPQPLRKLQNEQMQCELFTNSLCLHIEDYPTEAIMQSIRRNKATAVALLADFKEPDDGVVDGVTADQEAKYTAEHYLISNRRGDTANRDFASAGEAGFMCPSTVKYARPQRARATSGQWKYIVNTGEHTQTLRLEKCLKPKEACTYLTDNFKSKCIQVYNYHRLLTWDQQNGLHMDIFKVPTCCSCHIEGYNVAFPPLGQRIQEIASEHFPGEDLSSDQGNQAFEDVQSSVPKPSVTKSPSFNFNKPKENSFIEKHNKHSSLFSHTKINNDEINKIQPLGPTDSYGNSYFIDSLNQASSIRNIKRPIARNPIGIGSPSGFISSGSGTLPSYLEPPTPSAPSGFEQSKESSSKIKITEGKLKRGSSRPQRRPIRKKLSAPDDLISSGTSAMGTYEYQSGIDVMDEFNEEHENVESVTPSHLGSRITISPKLHAISIEKNINQFDETKVNQANFVNDKRINYNYHPIIDFFGEERREADSIDREDNFNPHVPASESEWKPINHNPSNINTLARKKHK
ncbi:neurotrophin 1 [Leptidea sinapis]|uniref:neurotrophin 1 n=1 Tax=Leptidea sinapis TaxID=189913 RepID=UPI0021C47B21|nr:neurotrophin 1 [Leptidea sinapis]